MQAKKKEKEVIIQYIYQPLNAQVSLKFILQPVLIT